MRRVSTRDVIATTAIGLFNEHGTASVSTNHIARAMGISPGNLYYHFANKEEIIREIYGRMIHEMDSAWKTDLNTSASLEMVFQALNAVHRFMVDYRFFQRELSALIRNDEQLAAIYKVARKRRMKEIGKFFEHMVDSGVIRRPDNPHTMPRLVRLGWMVGDYWLDFLDIEGRPMDAAHIGEGVEMIREIFRPYIVDDKRGEI